MAKAKRANVNKLVAKNDEIKLKPTKRALAVKPAKLSKAQRTKIDPAAIDQRDSAVYEPKRQSR